MADTCVARVPVFAGLSPDDQHRVEVLARPTHLHAGETAYSADDDVSQLMVLHTGRLKIFRLSADGSEQLVRVLLPGEFTGEPSVFAGQRPDGYATALDESQLCVFRHDDLEALITQHPDIGLRKLDAVSERLSDTEHRLSSPTQLTDLARRRGPSGRLPPRPAQHLAGSHRHGDPAAGQEGRGRPARHDPRELQPGPEEPRRPGADRRRRRTVGVDHAT